MTIEVRPGGSVHVAQQEKDLLQSTAVSTPFTVRGHVFVLPVGFPLERVVEVTGYPHDPGGLLNTDRLTSGHIRHEYVMTVPHDPELEHEIGLNDVTIDEVLYVATKP